MDFTLIIPDETLCYIFALVQVVEPGASRPFLIMLDAPPRPSVANVLGWIKITFVNRRWRRVAVDDATLWTQLNGELGWNWVDEFIRRSKNAPLRLDARSFPPSSNENTMPVKGLVADYHARIAELRLLALSPDSLIILDELLSYPFEGLEELNLTTDHGVNGSKPLTSLLQRTPRLRRLVLNLPHVSYATLEWRSACLAALTNLDLMLDSGASSALTPPFLDALREMEALTHLAIHESSPTLQLTCNHHCSGTPEDLIHLRNVKSLVAVGSLDAHAHLIRHIRLSSSARINLFTHRLVPNPLDASSTYNALANELNSFIRAYNKPPSYTSTYMSFSNIDDDIPEGPGNLFLSLGLDYGSRSREPVPVSTDDGKPWDPHQWYGTNDLSIRLHDAKASDILARIPLNSIRSLTLLDAGLSPTQAQLSHFPNVERLSLRTRNTPLPHTARGLQLLENLALLPKLRIIDMDSTSFDFSTVLMGFAQGAPGDVPIYPVLDDVLRARRQAGLPLQAIYLHIAEQVAETLATRQPVMVAAIERLKAIEGVEIVSQDFEVFAA